MQNSPLWVPGSHGSFLVLLLLCRNWMKQGFENQRWLRWGQQSKHCTVRCRITEASFPACMRDCQLGRPTRVCLSQCQDSRNGPVEPHFAIFPAAETLPSTPSLPPAARVCRTYRSLVIFRASTSALFWIEISQRVCEWLRKKRSGRQGQHVGFISTGELSKKLSRT